MTLDELSDLQTPWCVRVAVTLRIAEHISDGIHDVAALAAAADCNPDALHGVLSHLVAKGVFRESPARCFQLNDVARELLQQDTRLGLDLDGIGGRFAYAWGTLLQCVRTGEPAYHDVFGVPFWEDLNANPEIGASFDALMGPAGHGTPDPEVLVNGDWDAVTTVVDVGGGTGALLAEILRRHAHIRGVLVDFPRTIARWGEMFDLAGVRDRVQAQGQSFFDPLPPGADLYVLSKIINDWPNREATAILARCAEAVRPGGRVVVIGGVSPDEPRRGFSLEMVLVGGTERSLAQFEDLARAAGLKVAATGRTPSGRFVVECRPA
jgi:2,7-dihydroxy-5-methyl-1-naphthoate 7-O-methyltransferase